MDEKTVIVGKMSKKTAIIPLIIGGCLFILGFLLYSVNFGGAKISSYSGNKKPFGDLLFFTSSTNSVITVILYLGLLLMVIGVIFYIAVSKVSITVTDKRVYGTATRGKRVDLPFDSISAVSTAMFNSIAVATSSGSIKFSCIENYEDVHKEISKLLIDRQNAGKSTIIVEKETVADKDIAAELKKYNELLKEGIITQDEFDAKKKQLLEL